MAKSDRRSSDAFEEAGEDLKSVTTAGPAGALLTAMIILGLIAIAVLGIMLLFRY